MLFLRKLGYATPFLATNNLIIRKTMHTKCRSSPYPFSSVNRFNVPDDKVLWSANFENYSPPDYDSPILENKPWADPKIDSPNFNPKWNELDNATKTNRQSHEGNYEIVNKRPLNPRGRTGLSGRGILGKWGPNHAADPIVTRWKCTQANVRDVNSATKLPILQFCAIQRKDCGQWAIPGGMVDPGEHVSETLKREFLEEAFNSIEADKEQSNKNEAMIKTFFSSSATEIYRGYVDDPRNTDNAWMETVAMNFHDDDNSTVGQFNLVAGDDAQNVKWVDIDRKLDLYASHASFIEKVAQIRKAHW